jgi:hypothetical protein
MYMYVFIYYKGRIHCSLKCFIYNTFCRKSLSNVHSILYNLLIHYCCPINIYRVAFEIRVETYVGP